MTLHDAARYLMLSALVGGAFLLCALIVVAALGKPKYHKRPDADAELATAGMDDYAAGLLRDERPKA